MQNPSGSQWFLAEIVEEILVEEDSRNVIHISFILVTASSPEEALKSTERIGIERQDEYYNPAGKLVTIRFRGLHGLHRIHEEFEHGAEILYEEYVGLTEQEVGRLILRKDQLGLFRSREPFGTKPDYRA